jgi:hypothetical protein
MKHFIINLSFFINIINGLTYKVLFYAKIVLLGYAEGCHNNVDKSSKLVPLLI